jgi:hypothetical protein
VPPRIKLHKGGLHPDYDEGEGKESWFWLSLKAPDFKARLQVEGTAGKVWCDVSFLDDSPVFQVVDDGGFWVEAGGEPWLISAPGREAGSLTRTLREQQVGPTERIPFGIANVHFYYEELRLGQIDKYK